MKLVFMGTPAFAVPSLERMVEAGHQVVAVVTQPDRPKGRGQKDALSPVKEAALRLGLTVHQPARVRRPEVVAQLRAMAPDAMVVVGYGQIIPKAILEIPPLGIINVHASLLPKYRGAAPIQWAIARGETSTGVTTMRINEGLDTGDMLLKWETAIGPEENAVELGRRLAVAGAELLVRTLDRLPAIKPEPQDESQATYAPILKKEDGKIDWTLSAREILNRIRGFEPWPGGYGFLRGQRFHIWSAAIGDQKLPPGALRAVNRKLYAGCGSEESIELREVQLEGKKRMPAAAFMNGFPLSDDGEVLL
jgi:methionyl-tRNA formyltransferase